MDINGPCILLSRQLDPPLHPAMEPPWTAHPFSDMQISFRPAHRSTCYLLGPECLPIPFLCLTKSSSFFKIYGKCYLFCDTPPNPHLISGQSLLYFPQHFAHISILHHPQQYRDFLSRWIMSHLKTPFIAYSHTYLQLLTELLCT